MLERWVTNYGTRCNTMLDGVQNQADLGIQFSDDLYQIEVDYLIEHEYAQQADDIFWRRTKLGIDHDVTCVEQVTQYLTAKAEADTSQRAVG